MNLDTPFKNEYDSNTQKVYIIIDDKNRVDLIVGNQLVAYIQALYLENSKLEVTMPDLSQVKTHPLTKDGIKRYSNRLKKIDNLEVSYKTMRPGKLRELGTDGPIEILEKR